MLMGILLPWVYFLFVKISPMNIYENGVLVRKATQQSGIASFVEFNGVTGSLMIYLKVFAILFVATYLICTLNEFFKKQFQPKL